jgi:hypothetical protein
LVYGMRGMAMVGNKIKFMGVRHSLSNISKMGIYCVQITYVLTEQFKVMSKMK